MKPGKETVATETNRLILAGTHERVYVVELVPGDILTFGGVVRSVERVTDTRTVVTTDCNTYRFGKADTTIVVRKRA